MSDGSLREQLLEYLDEVANAPDEPCRRPVYMRGRIPTEQFVDVSLEPPPWYLDKLRESSAPEPKLDWPDHYTWSDISGSEWERIVRPFDDSVDDWVSWKDEFFATIDKSCRHSAKRKSLARRVLLLGDPGQGKSLLLQMAARKIAIFARNCLQRQQHTEDTVPLPILLTAKSLKSQPRGEDASEGLRSVLKKCLKDAKRGPADYVADHAHEWRTWLLIDGVDEVQPNQIQWALNTLEKWNCRLILTSRPDDLAIARLPFEYIAYRILPLDTRGVKKFLNNWYRGQKMGDQVSNWINAVPLVAELASTPLLLTLLCYVVETASVPLSTTRGGLLSHVITALLGLSPGTETSVGDDRRLDKSRSRSMSFFTCLLEVLSDVLTQDSAIPRITTDLLLEALRHSDRPPLHQISPHDACHLTPNQQAMAVLKELEDVGLLVPVDSERSAYEFIHRTFLEYLLAFVLARWIEGAEPFTLMHSGKQLTLSKEQGWEYVAAKSWDPKWSEVIVLLAGMLKDPAPLLRLLSDETKDDLNRCRLALAGRCISEIPLAWRDRHETFLRDIAHKVLRMAVDFYHPNPPLTSIANAFPDVLRNCLLELVGTTTITDKTQRALWTHVNCAVGRGYDESWEVLVKCCIKHPYMSMSWINTNSLGGRIIQGCSLPLRKAKSEEIVNEYSQKGTTQEKLNVYCLLTIMGKDPNCVDLSSSQETKVLEAMFFLMNVVGMYPWYRNETDWLKATVVLCEREKKSSNIEPLSGASPHSLAKSTTLKPDAPEKHGSDTSETSLQLFIPHLLKRDWKKVFEDAKCPALTRKALQFAFDLAPQRFEEFAGKVERDTLLNHSSEDGTLDAHSGKDGPSPWRPIDMKDSAFSSIQDNGQRRFREAVTLEVITKTVEELSRFNFAITDEPPNVFNLVLNSEARCVERDVPIEGGVKKSKVDLCSSLLDWNLLEILAKGGEQGATKKQLEGAWRAVCKDVPDNYRTQIHNLSAKLGTLGLKIVCEKDNRRRLCSLTEDGNQSPES